MSSAVTSGRNARFMMAALLTRMSSRPNAFFTAANSAGISAGLPTSAWTATASPPAVLMSATTSSAAAGLLA